MLAARAVYTHDLATGPGEVRDGLPRSGVASLAAIPGRVGTDSESGNLRMDIGLYRRIGPRVRWWERTQPNGPDNYREVRTGLDTPRHKVKDTPGTTESIWSSTVHLACPPVATAALRYARQLHPGN